MTGTSRNETDTEWQGGKGLRGNEEAGESVYRSVRATGWDRWDKRGQHGRFEVGESEAERFWSKVERTPDGCWLWTGRMVDGYGRFDTTAGHQMRAHRWAWESHHGRPVPQGLTLDHLVGAGEPCTSTLCVNPDHLEAVTNSENLRRRHARRRAQETSR